MVITVNLNWNAEIKPCHTEMSPRSVEMSPHRSKNEPAQRQQMSP